MPDEPFNGGWVKLHRKILENPRFADSKWFHLWGFLLLSANHATKKILFNGNLIDLEPGQFITGRNIISAKTRISPTSVERLLTILETEQQIGQRKTTQNRLITILNWESYQKVGQQNGQRADSEWTTDGQQTDTIKNDKNDKKVQEGKEEEFVLSGEPGNEEGYHKDARALIHILNEAAGKRFREQDGNLSIISARLMEPGVTFEEVKKMILRQSKVWAGTRFTEYLRPKTLFGPENFENYYANRDSEIITNEISQTNSGRNAGTANEKQTGAYAGIGKRKI